jgi:excisionase family DNA binding protein
MSKDYLSAGEVAALFDVSDKTVYHWVKAGLLRAKKASIGKIVITVDDIEEFAVKQGIEVINRRVLV